MHLDKHQPCHADHTFVQVCRDRKREEGKRREEERGKREEKGRRARGEGERNEN